MEIIVLKHVSYNKGNEHITFFTKQIGEKYKFSKDLSFIDKNKSTIIISFEFVNFLESIDIEDNFNFIDVENLKRQIIGRSKNEFKKKEKPWLIWNMISELNPNDLGLNKKVFNENINNGKAMFLGIVSKSLDVSKMYSFILNCIEIIYLNLKEELATSNEKERFEKIEMKLNNILFKTNKLGIKIDVKKVKQHIQEINIQLYEIKNKLQLEFGIFSLHDYNNIQKRLIKDFKWFADIKVNTKEFWEAISLQKNNSEFIELLYLERKLTKDKTILSRIGSLDIEYVFPTIDYFGTITGRILVNSPSLQQLNKKYRDIIIPEKKMQLVYIDYSQFEAGILAFEANESKLIEMYNNDDIYTQISNKLGNESVTRDLAKKLFFCYCYGMSKENILKYSGKNLNLFFDEFSNLEIYEEKILKDFLEDGFVETTLGNRRYKSLRNVENIKEGWLISQKIQGKASLILKEVILDLYNKDKEIEFLLPMHDAVLYQVPKDKTKELTEKIENSFKNVLQKYCPTLKPKITNKAFFEVK